MGTWWHQFYTLEQQDRFGVLWDGSWASTEDRALARLNSVQGQLHVHTLSVGDTVKPWDDLEECLTLSVGDAVKPWNDLEECLNKSNAGFEGAFNGLSSASAQDRNSRTRDRSPSLEEPHPLALSASTDCGVTCGQPFADADHSDLFSKRAAEIFGLVTESVPELSHRDSTGDDRLRRHRLILPPPSQSHVSIASSFPPCTPDTETTSVWV